MTNPVLVEITRGAVIENRHRGAAVVSDSSGTVALEIGDIDRPVFPRSAIKVMQALPLIESGTADALGLEDKHLALACSSHSSETAHVSVAMDMLRRSGLDETALECGAHWPIAEPAMIALAANGEYPGPRHNNCSGKHAGFLCTCIQTGIRPQGYVNPDHELQQIIRGVLEYLTGSPHAMDHCGRDGCSIPTYAIPLRGLARGFARMSDGQGMDRSRHSASERLMSACMAEPFFVAGTDRACTRLMQTAPGRIFVKVGADGVYCGAIPELGLGIALKIDDGTERAAIAAIASVLARLFANDEALQSLLLGQARIEVKNRNEIVTGEIRPAGPLEG